jgi:hypothetical protein
MKPIMLAFVLISLFAFGACPVWSQSDNRLIRGTINVAAGNSHGMVVITDSTQTFRDENGKFVRSAEAQKLFQLDDRSVCAIAGFGGATIGTAPQFNADIAGVILELRDQLKRYAPQSFELKLRMLSSQVSFYLSTIANLNETILTAKVAPHTYTFTLFLVGYDSDQTPKIGTLIILAKVGAGPASSRQWTSEERIEVWPIGMPLIAKLGGMFDAAQQVLSHPENYPGIPVVSQYADSMKNNQGSSLGLSELKALAEFLSAESARKHPLEIGGHRQECIFADGKIKTFEAPSFPDPPRPLRYSLMLDLEMRGNAIQTVSESPTLWVRCLIQGNPSVSLDNNYFIGSEIRDSIVSYNGGPILLDKTNKLSTSMLQLGPDASHNLATVRMLRTQFHWSSAPPNVSGEMYIGPRVSK